MDHEVAKAPKHEDHEALHNRGTPRSSCFLVFVSLVPSWSKLKWSRLATPLTLLLVAACTLPGNAAPVLKLGVIAPFEGQGRALGYAVLPEIKAVVAEQNASGVFGPYRVTVVAFNDSLDPATAGKQAAALALDPDVIGVVGPFSVETAAAAEPVLARSGIPVEPLPAVDALGEDFSAEANQAKEAARSLLRRLAEDIEAHGQPARPAEK